MYFDNFRNIDEDTDNFDDPNYLYELETHDLPHGCPYRQFVPFPPFFGGPGQGPQGPQGPGGHGGQGAPTSPPPNFTPTKSSAPLTAHGGPALQAVDPGAIKPCTHRFVYIWPRRGRPFWAWITFVGRRSVSGFRWNGFRWTYFGMDLRNIDSFQCF
jgi:hypothetical protein